MINHERIHLRQQLEMLLVFFYLWYVIEWMIHYVFCRNWWQAYYLISFEKEAYQNENDFEYLKNKTFWSFLNYL
jgi:hypothetical protein